MVRSRNQGVALLHGISSLALDAARAPADLAGAWVVPDTGGLYHKGLYDTVPALIVNRDVPLARAVVVHLAGGGTALTGACACRGGGSRACMQLLELLYGQACKQGKVMSHVHVSAPCVIMLCGRSLSLVPDGVLAVCLYQGQWAYCLQHGAPTQPPHAALHPPTPPLSLPCPVCSVCAPRAGRL